MTPRERVEAVACAAWGVRHVTASTYPHGTGVVAFAAAARESADVPRSENAWGTDHDEALTRLERIIVGEAARDTAARERAWVEAQVAALDARRAMLAIACAVPCREHVARCEGVAPCREVMPRVRLTPLCERLDGYDAAHSTAWCTRNAGVPWGGTAVLARPLWWRHGRKGRACRDPRKHAATCKAMP